MGNRRKSFDSDSSDSSSSGSDSGGYDKKKKVKKDKKDKKNKKDKPSKEHKDQDKSKDIKGAHYQPVHNVPGMSAQHNIPVMPQVQHGGDRQAPFMPSPGPPTPHFPQAHGGQDSPAGFASPPVSGYRIPLSGTSPFPALHALGTPPCYDMDGKTPIYIGSALFENSVHPCKIGEHLNTHVGVAYGGEEVGHRGRFDLLPYTPDTMEFVRASGGRIPQGRRPVEGGYEENGSKLYHAVALVNGVRVPGKAGEHLGGCNVGFGGQEHSVADYELLCWR